MRLETVHHLRKVQPAEDISQKERQYVIKLF